MPKLCALFVVNLNDYLGCVLLSNYDIIAGKNPFLVVGYSYVCKATKVEKWPHIPHGM